MKLVIDNCNDKQFIIYLINFIKQYLIDHSRSQKFSSLDMYLNKIPKYKTKFRKSLTCHDIVICGAYNLVYRKYGKKYIITINENQKLFGLDAKLYDMCKLINYGTLEIDGYPIFTDAFNYVQDNLEMLYFRYNTGL